MLKICVAGKNDIAVNILQYLYDNCMGRYELCVVCTRTELGKDGWQMSLRRRAKKLEVQEYVLEELYSISELIFLSMEYDRIIKPEFFQTTQLYNIHFSLLPAYRGMFTSVIPILNNEKESGVTFHVIDDGIDTGNIIDQERIPILQNDTSRDLYMKYIEIGTKLVIRNIIDVVNGNVFSYKQDSTGASYYSKDYIDFQNIELDLNQTAEGINNQIRAYMFREYQLPKIFDYDIISAKITDIRSHNRPGTVIYQTDSEMMLSSIDYNIICYFDRFNELLVACENGDIRTVEAICVVGKHINEKNEEGWSPLIVATYYNQIEIAKKLISLGADIYVKDNKGINLMMFAKVVYQNLGDSTLLELYKKLGLKECK